MALVDSIFPLRPLRDGELCQLGPAASPQPTSLTQIKSSHHRIARLCAQGLSDLEVSSATGYHINTIRSLRSNNPGFQALVKEYETAAHQESLDVIGRMAQVGFLAVEELGDRLSEAPAEFSNRELLEVVRDMIPQARENASANTTKPSPVTIQFVSSKDVSPIIEGEKN